MKFLVLLYLLLQIPVSIAQSYFDDRSLGNLLQESNSGIIFVWSPLMPLSVLGLQEIVEIAETNHIELTVLIDPYPQNQFKATDVIFGSQILVERGMLNHFPALALYKDHKLIPWMIQGYENKNSLEMLIKNKLELP